MTPTVLTVVPLKGPASVSRHALLITVSTVQTKCVSVSMFLSHGSGMNVNVDSYVVSVHTRSFMYTK